MSIRNQLLNIISDEIIEKSDKSNCFFVGIDGYDGAGKTYFAGELRDELKRKHQNVIQSSVDYFHNPRKVRYKKGKDSPIGYYEDSFNYQKFQELLLDPLKADNPKGYFAKYFHHRTDKIAKSSLEKFKGNSILIVDGIFLHRPELIAYWDYSIFLKVSREETLKRCFYRENEGSPDINSTKNKRYVEGQNIYFNKNNPESKATVVIDNEAIDSPYIQR